MHEISLKPQKSGLDDFVQRFHRCYPSFILTSHTRMFCLITRVTTWNRKFLHVVARKHVINVETVLFRLVCGKNEGLDGIFPNLYTSTIMVLAISKLVPTRDAISQTFKRWSAFDPFSDTPMSPTIFRHFETATDKQICYLKRSTIAVPTCTCVVTIGKWTNSK